MNQPAPQINEYYSWFWRYLDPHQFLPWSAPPLKIDPLVPLRPPYIPSWTSPRFIYPFLHHNRPALALETPSTPSWTSPHWWIWSVIHFDASHVQIDPPVPHRHPSIPSWTSPVSLLDPHLPPPWISPADEYDSWFILTPLTFKLIPLSLLDPHLLILDQPRWWIWQVIHFDASHVKIDSPYPSWTPIFSSWTSPVDEYDSWFMLTPLTFKLIRLSNWSNCYPSRLTGYHGNQGWLICNLIQMSYKWFLSLHPSLTLSARGRTLVVRIWRL